VVCVVIRFVFVVFMFSLLCMLVAFVLFVFIVASCWFSCSLCLFGKAGVWRNVLFAKRVVCETNVLRINCCLRDGFCETVVLRNVCCETVVVRNGLFAKRVVCESVCLRDSLVAKRVLRNGFYERVVLRSVCVPRHSTALNSTPCTTHITSYCLDYQVHPRIRHLQ
jgi:hypothetical protein